MKTIKLISYNKGHHTKIIILLKYIKTKNTTQLNSQNLLKKFIHIYPKSQCQLQINNTRHMFGQCLVLAHLLQKNNNNNSSIM